MTQNFRHIFLALVLAMLSFSANAQFYQGSYNEFGKNRVQYREFLWQQYRFQEFDTYFYEGGQQLAEFTSKVAGQSMSEIEDMFDSPISDKIQFIVYNSQSDFKQSNIGLTEDDQFNIGGAARIVGSKVFVYFEGDYMAFSRQIKDGLARVVINNVLYGGNWRQVIKNSTLLNLPDWYIEGLIMYSSQNVDRDIESRIRSGILTGKYENFNRLQGQEAHEAGYALWNYVADVYGANIIQNILYMSRVSRNVESGFLFVLGKSLDTITKEFIAYYEGEYAFADLSKSAVDMEELPIKTKKGRVYTQFEISPDGNYVAYASNEMGQYRLYIYDVQEGKRKKILKAEHRLDRITDYSYPVMAWHPSGKALTYVREWRGKLTLNTYNLEDKKTQKREIFSLDKVLSLDYSPNGQQLIFSGVNNGQTDLYLYYTIGNRQEQLTFDYYGDFQPSFSLDGTKIIFSSTRPDDTLRYNPDPVVFYENRDVFAFRLEKRSPYLERITNTPNLVELDPVQYDSLRYSFLAAYDGVENRYVATYDSTISRIDTTIHYRYFTVANALTNYRSDILTYSIQPKTGIYAFMNFDDGKYHFYTGNIRDDKFVSKGKSQGSDSGDSAGGGDTNDDGIETLSTITLDDGEQSDNKKGEIAVKDYRFEGEKDFTYEKQTITITEKVDETDAEVGYDAESGKLVLDSLAFPGARNYNINFTTDQVAAQLDNTFMTQFYQPLSGVDNLNPGLSLLTKYAASDLFEDYKIKGGFRVAGSLDNNTVMLMGQNLAKRMDKKVQLYREAQRGTNRLGVFELITYSAALQYSWPFNEVMSVKGSLMYRNDQTIVLALDQRSASAPSEYTNRIGLKAEFVFDNTLDMGLNLRRGMRWKVWGEYYRDPVDFDTDFIVFGGDFRHYQKIHRKLIWANRLAFSTSLGKERLVYFLGGVDDWLFPKQDNSLAIDPEQNYQFQTRASPMRGFYANARNGNSMAMINTELRWPIFNYLFNKPLKSDFLENFQVITFADVGSAWTGPTPYSDENTFNTQTIETGNLSIWIKDNRDPIVYGYGFGLRSRLLGYFVRVDWAWGVDDGVVLDRVFYLSLAMDF
jgi:Tol biopolymer transport system component